MRILLSPIVGWAAILAIGGLVIVGLITPWGLGLDFSNFYDIGRKARLGEYDTLYDHMALIGGEKPLGNMKYLSPPITSWFFTPLSFMTPHVATFVLKALGAAAVIAGILLFRRQISPLITERAAFFTLAAVAAALWQPLWTFMRVGGQTTPFCLLLLVLGHGAYLRGRMVSLALILSLVVLIKPVFAPLAILLFVLAGNSFRMTALLTAGLSIVASLAIFGWGPHQAFLDALGGQGDRLLEPWMNSSPVSWVVPILVDAQSFGTIAAMPKSAAVLIMAIRLVLALAILAVMVGHLRAGLPERAGRHVIYMTGLLLVIVLSPVIWAHYLMILFPLIMVLIAVCEDLAPLVRQALWVALALGLAQSFIIMRQIQIRLGFDTSFEMILFGLIKSLPAILICGLWIFGRRSIGRALARPEWQSVAA